MRRVLTLCSSTAMLLLLGHALVAAHPGALDGCGGHTETEWVEYPPQADGQPTVPSEPGEYHFHFTPAQVDESFKSLRAYQRQQRNAGTGRIDDLGTFTVGDLVYDILEYTRQGQEIIRCRDESEDIKTGIQRVRLP